ncbi:MULTISPECIES: GIY-YIG nuclease family protein [Globicatella]|uniref:GIY-YIG nuclease family protein n=2 Tax=Globicatella sulfidifaciens TaxID=136093 RepID=A0A7X8C566_9LACT|nr:MULTISPECIES: GIY-YIG nuclease family protein [Globicatella]NLJ19146.1 GIY-YIG nuclease family protein [Globicatella sulfidifaciens]WPC09496.1 GIY-YIG nuclease family protein [Globicatella sp. PHS-GS-PNBC-21-1553]SJZ39156.1 putative endonuclease [Globicatella sulfidifaciens DSM 15739]HJF16391.1 GIY-YIG nuclease family protein [Globicatella sulfidifaciens]
MENETHFFYVLYCQDNTLYGGYTNDLSKRLLAHQTGKGAKYTRVKKRQPVKLIYAERWSTKQKAMSQEYHFKKQTRMQKEQYLKAAGVQDYSNGTFVLVNGQEEAEDESTKELS